MNIIVYTYSVFHNNGIGGNIAGVVKSDENLTDNQMLKISKKMNISEVVFISKNKQKRYKLRYFTPTMEIEYCGHATLAAYFHLFNEKYISKGTYLAETMSGDIEIKVENDGRIVSYQQKPIFGETITIDSIQDIFSIPLESYDISKFEPKIISTGVKDIFVPICSRADIMNIKPNYELMTEYNKKSNTVGFHLFTFDTFEKNSTAFCRNFAPLYGIDEESATGSSSGALGCYLAQNSSISKSSYIFEQGDYMKMSSRISVDVSIYNNEINSVSVGGYILYNKRYNLIL